VFSFVRNHGGQRLLIVTNFSEQPQYMDANQLRVYGPGYRFTDLITGKEYRADYALQLAPYQAMWLTAAG
jgi:hypothetical protein